MKTIKQMADEIGIDKQRVYRYIKKNHISEAHQDNGVMWYDEVAEMSVLRHFSKECVSGDVHQEAHQAVLSDVVIDTVIAMLQKELEVKNEQIKELNARLAESNAALVTAQQSAQAAQALHAGTMARQLAANEESEGLWRRIFKRKRNSADS